jgi:hypothetical protein
MIKMTHRPKETLKYQLTRKRSFGSVVENFA